MHKLLGPVLEKVHFDPQVRQLRDGFNVMCEIAFVFAWLYTCILSDEINMFKLKGFPWYRYTLQIFAFVILVFYVFLLLILTSDINVVFLFLNSKELEKLCPTLISDLSSLFMTTVIQLNQYRHNE